MLQTTTHVQPQPTSRGGVFVSASKGKGYVFENVKVLLAIIISVIVIVIGVVALVLNAVVQTWPTQTSLGTAALVTTGIGLLAFIILGLRMAYHRLAWQVKEKLDLRAECMEAEKKNMGNGGTAKKKNTTPKSESSNDKKDILNAIRLDIRGIREYYTISKNNVRYSFLLSIVFCVVGLLLFVVLALTGFKDQTVTIFVSIMSAASELFAGTAFLMYKSALDQLNIYYEELHDNEMLLAAVQLAERLPEKGEREKAYIEIINGAIKIMTECDDKKTTEDKNSTKKTQENNDGKIDDSTESQGKESAPPGAETPIV
jgi:hypothetical protein